MKKQYLVQYTFKKDPTKWLNAAFVLGIPTNHFDSLKDAEMAVKHIKEHYNKPYTMDGLHIAATRIREREVTEWKEVK